MHQRRKYICNNIDDINRLTLQKSTKTYKTEGKNCWNARKLKDKFSDENHLEDYKFELEEVDNSAKVQPYLDYL